MREILFRGKRRLGNEWIEGSLHTEKFTDDEEYLCCEINQCDVYPETVGQYTGLTDKNGSKIFEGDIRRHYGNYSGKNIYAPVVFELGMFYLKYDEKAGMPLGDMCERVEVIGNIHDNPGLLKGGEG